MTRTRVLQEIRRMRFEEAYGGWQERRLTQEEAARLLGVCERTFRRYIDRYEDEGLEGLVDKRLGQVSARRAPGDEVLRTEALYRERYEGWNVKHLYRFYRRRHAGERSCTWVKHTLQRAGLVAKAPGRGDVALVVVVQQHPPVGNRALVPRGLPSPPVDDPGSCARSPEGVGPGIDRALQNLAHCMVGGRPPLDMRATELRRTTGRLSPADRNHRYTWRELPSSGNFSNTRRIASATRSSGSSSMRPFSAQQKTGGRVNRSSPRAALMSRAARPRWRSRLSSYSDIVPLSPYVVQPAMSGSTRNPLSTRALSPNCLT